MVSMDAVLLLVPAEGITMSRLHKRLEGFLGRPFDAAHTRKVVRRGVAEGWLRANEYQDRHLFQRCYMIYAAPKQGPQPMGRRSRPRGAAFQTRGDGMRAAPQVARGPV